MVLQKREDVIPDFTKIQLTDVPLFQDLSASELRAVRPALREKAFCKDEIIHMAGNSCETILIVMSGQVKVFRSTPDGKEQVLEVLNPGDTCACHPGSEEQWSCANMSQALTDCRVWLLARREYVRLVNTNHRLTHKLNRIFAERLCRFSSLIEDISLENPEKRLARFILDMAQSLPSTKSEELKFTHEEVAQRIGLVRETVTRHLNKLKRLGLIDLKPSRIIIRDQKGLKKLILVQ